ncbi:MAG: hypothetical protein ACI361_09835, partial [Atopobiaceae bacterium]
MNAKSRVVLFLVEGPSDEDALMRPFSSLLMQRNAEPSRKAESEAFRCDVTTVRLFKGNVNFRIDRKMKNTVRSFILDRIERRHAYTWNDLDLIVHLVDLDGAFIPDANIHQADCTGFVYGPNFIEARNTSDVIRRNHEKASAIRELIACSNLTYRKKEVPYRLYFVSRNLEHALYGIERDCTDSEKRALSIAFADKYVNDIEAFEALLCSDNVRVSAEDWHSS